MTVRLGPFYGGGLVLGYRCTSRCRHCLYACAPGRRDGKPEAEELDALLDRLQELAPRARWHIGGGEPFCHPELLGRAVQGMARRGMALEYIETNASWVKDRDGAGQRLQELAELGLPSLLVSLSPFHAEFVPLEKTFALIEAARAELPGGAFVWIPDFAPDLANENPERPLDLDALLARRGDDYARGLARRYGLVPAGRAGRYLARHGQGNTWHLVVGHAPCAHRLRDTSHFHVDGQGLYMPGLCAGIALPLDALNGPIDPARFPVFTTLAEQGLPALLEQARGLGFAPLAAGYSEACDLCTHVRLFLHKTRPSEDLAPTAFYDERFLDGFEEG